MTNNRPPVPEGWEFRLSPDRRLFAFYDPGNGPWFVPEPAMRGRFVDVSDMNALDWYRYVPEPKEASGDAEPDCKFKEGCHRVVVCDPGCAVTTASLYAQLAGASNGRQAAYDAVFAYIREQPRDFVPTTIVARNAMIWRAVNAALDVVLSSADPVTTPTRTKWPSAQHLQQAADLTREPDPNLDPERGFYTAPLGDWLDQVANDMACWAPYREHEGGYRPWRTATRAAHGVLGLPDADDCPVCHPPRRPAAG